MDEESIPVCLFIDMQVLVYIIIYIYIYNYVLVIPKEGASNSVGTEFEVATFPLYGHILKWGISGAVAA